MSKASNAGLEDLNVGLHFDHHIGFSQRVKPRLSQAVSVDRHGIADDRGLGDAGRPV